MPGDAWNAMWAGALYLAVAAVATGFGWRCFQYYRSSDVLRMPGTPAPLTRLGVLRRLLLETFLFVSLYKADRVLWAVSWLFHGSLLTLLVMHLRFLDLSLWVLIAPVLWLGPIAAGIALTSVLVLLARRIVLPRVRYVSTPVNYLVLIWIAVTLASGLILRHVHPTDVYAVMQFLDDAMRARTSSLPRDPWLAVHLGFALVLVAALPLERLVHGFALWWMPTRNQREAGR